MFTSSLYYDYPGYPVYACYYVYCVIKKIMQGRNPALL